MKQVTIGLPSDVYELWAKRTHALYAIKKVLQTLPRKKRCQSLIMMRRNNHREAPERYEGGNTQKTTKFYLLLSAALFFD